MLNKLKIKICGMRDPDNIREISALQPDYMGFIFYPGSKRYAPELPVDVMNELPVSIEKVGVFVDSEPGLLLQACSKFGIGTVQLHGDESPEYCKELSDRGLKIIKAFRLGTELDSAAMSEYQPSCHLFLMYTHTDLYGGSGHTFDWGLLQEYTLETPFFLSGGISPEDSLQIRKLEIPQLYGIDINSRFETAPACKDPDLCANFIKQIRMK